MRNLEQYLPGDGRNSGVFNPQDPSSKGNILYLINIKEEAVILVINRTNIIL